MALLAAEWWVDLVMTYQAVGHLWQIGWPGKVYFVQGTMTCFTGVIGIQIRADVP